VNLTEETSDSRSAPGRAAVLSTVVLLLTYLAVAAAVLSFAGPDWLAGEADEEEAVFGLLSSQVLGGWDWVVLVAVATSAIASTQTTIIPASRTALSMARRAALPRRFASISPRHRTPDVSTWWVAAVAVAWYLGVGLISENALFDSITALSLLIALYYALTGIACAVYFRRRLTRSPRNLLVLGVGPLVGAGMLLWLLVLSLRDLADPANSYTGQSWLGAGPPLVIGVGILLAGAALMLWWRSRDATFWRERPGVAEDEAHSAG
jgi:amino acid transporter